MKNNYPKTADDNRLPQIREMLLHLVNDDFNFRLPLSESNDEMDAIIVGLNTFAEEVSEKHTSFNDNEKRLKQILNILLKTTQLDFSQKMEISETGDLLDAIAAGMNTLSEELEAHILELEEKEEQIQTIFKNAPDAVIVIKSSGEIIAWNKKAEDIFGWNAEEMIGKDISETIIPKRYRKQHHAGMANYMATGVHQILNKPIEMPALRKDNSEFLAGMSISPTRIRNEHYFIGFMRDITKQKQAEELKNFLSFIVESTEDAIYSKSTDGTIMSWNKGAEKIYGYKQDEIIGQNFSILIPAEDMDRIIQLNQKVAHGEKIDHFETTRIRKDGTPIQLSLTLSPIINYEKNQFIGISVIGKDITHKKKLEEEIARQALELSRSNKELEQFAYVASHDLQEPLRIITSYVQLLNKRYSDKLDGDATEFIQYVVEGTERMRNLINDLLTYSRVQTQPRLLEKIDMNVVLENVLDNLSESIKENNAVIQFTKMPLVLGDYSRLIQLFQNIIGNALKFKTENRPEIEIKFEESGDFYKFSISDNGIGIEEPYREKIFVIFQRLNGRGNYPGTGIGLAVCKKIVESDGGNIWVESNTKKGSTFCFTLKK